jgi:hypothetical protein
MKAERDKGARTDTRTVTVTVTGADTGKGVRGARWP